MKKDMLTITEKGKIALSMLQLPGIGRKTVSRFCELTDHVRCDADTLCGILNAAKQKSGRIKIPDEAAIVSAIRKADQIAENCARLGIQVLSFCDEAYPSRLSVIDDPPVILYALGSLSCLSPENKSIAVIGTLNPTVLGYRIAIRIGERIAEEGFVSVSGLALGCDTGGHTGTVQRDGRSVAILANGLDTVYPDANRDLARKILDCGGCLLSEYPPYTEMQRGYFVDRDRLQAALSDAIFVVETEEQDGTMHTVSFGVRYGKPIYCFRHADDFPAAPSIEGNRKLILEGTAIPVRDQEDISALFLAVRNAGIPTAENPESFEQLSLL